MAAMVGGAETNQMIVYLLKYYELLANAHGPLSAREKRLKQDPSLVAVQKGILVRTQIHEAISLAKRSRRASEHERQISNIRRELPIENRKTIDITPISDFVLERTVLPDSHFTLWLESVSTDGDVDGAALLQIECFNADGDAVRLDDWPDRSRRVGDFRYLIQADIKSPHITELSLKVPSDATRILITGHQWKQTVHTWVIGNAVVSVDENFASTALDSGTSFEVPYQSYRVELDIPSGADEIELTLHATEGKKAKLPFSVDFYNDADELLLPPADLAQHPLFGAFIQVSVEESRPVSTKNRFRIVPDAAKLRIRPFSPWSSSGRLVGPPAVDWRNDSHFSTTITHALANSDPSCALILIDSTAPPLGHQTLSIRPNNLAKEFGELGNKVVYFSFGSLQEHPSVLTENVVQFDRKDFAEIVDYLRKIQFGGPKIYYCTSYPHAQSLYTLDSLKRAGWQIVYEIRDNMEEFRRVGYSKWYEPEFEARFARRADSIITVSPALSRKIVALAQLTEQPTVIPNGVRPSIVERFAEQRDVDVLNNRSEHRIVGYVGHLTPAWFDWPLIIGAATATPSLTYELVGHGAPDGIALPDNVHVLGPKNHEELEEITPRWKQGIIPFIDSPLTRGVDPNKIYEYLAWGMRIVSAQMGSVDTYPATTVYKNRSQFIDQVLAQAETLWTAEELSAVETLLEESRWDARARQVMRTIEQKAGVNK